MTCYCVVYKSDLINQRDLYLSKSIPGLTVPESAYTKIVESTKKQNFKKEKLYI
jgi:hypothetical protein